MKKNRLLIFLILSIFLAGCTVSEMLEKSYYIFDYTDTDERTDLYMEESLPYSVMIQDARVSQTYTRKQIVKRHYGPQIRYLNYHLWGIRLQDAVSDLFTTRMEKYKIFANINRDMLVEAPDYQINIAVHNLEIYETAFLSEAHLNMEFSLVNMQKGQADCPVMDISYKIDRTTRVEQDDVEAFVQKVNEMILQESNNFMVKILNEFTGFQEQSQIVESKVSRYQEIDYSPEVLGDSITVDNSGIGLLYFPNLSGDDNEPYYYVKDRNGKTIEMARMGEEVPVKEGSYNVEYGSHQESRGMSQTVEVRPRSRYNVEPDWGCLIVDVMNEQRNYVKVSYTIFDNADGFDYGIDYPADVNLGEKSTVWVLKPGTYKITLNNESFNTYRDFTTIEVLEGFCQRLSLIVEEVENSGIYTLIGAGVINEEDSQRKDTNWNLSSAIHMNINLNTDNSENESDTQLSININAQLDNSAYYEYGRFKYTLKNLIEMGTNKDEDYDQFRVDLDDFDAKNTIIYNVFSAFGLYGRFDLNSHFLPVQAYDLNYIKIDEAGTMIDSLSNANSVETSSSFFPMTLKEGFGLNFQFLNTSRADMNLRFGLGSRQELRKDVFTISDTTHTNAGIIYKVYKEEQSDYYEGIEASLVGDLQVLRNLSYSLTADFLFPFDSEKNYTMDIENIVNVKLFKYISLDYRLKFYTRESDAQDDYISTQQSLFLRFTYLLR